jgi:3-phosphoglycerate kinase
MFMFKVTLTATTNTFGKPIEMQWVTFADTGSGAIEQVKDSIADDLLLLENIKFQSEKSEDPLLISIKE